MIPYPYTRAKTSRLPRPPPKQLASLTTDPTWALMACSSAAGIPPGPLPQKLSIPTLLPTPSIPLISLLIALDISSSSSTHLTHALTHHGHGCMSQGGCISAVEVLQRSHDATLGVHTGVARIPEHEQVLETRCSEGSKTCAFSIQWLEKDDKGAAGYMKFKSVRLVDF